MCSELTDEFVKAWLMLADVFIDAAKFDQAQDSLQVMRGGGALGAGGGRMP